MGRVVTELLAAFTNHLREAPTWIVLLAVFSFAAGGTMFVGWCFRAITDAEAPIWQRAIGWIVVICICIYIFLFGVMPREYVDH